MKSIILLSLMLILFVQLRAQDTTLPQGTVRIYLFSGKVIKDAYLWKIDTVQLEYVLNGNLGEIKTENISKIETAHHQITFGEGDKMDKRHYDAVVPYYNDTIWCFISEVNAYTIRYQPVGSKTVKSIPRTHVAYYEQWPENETKHISPVIKTDSMLVLPKDTSVNRVLLPPAVAHQSPGTDSTHKPTVHSAVVEPLPFPAPDKAVQEAAGWQYYHESYNKGVVDAAQTPTGNWGPGGFFLGPVGCFAVLPLSAANSSNLPSRVPAGVDQKLYKDGYKYQMMKKKVKTASTGALVAMGVVSFILVIITASAN